MLLRSDRHVKIAPTGHRLPRWKQRACSAWVARRSRSHIARLGLNGGCATRGAPAACPVAAGGVRRATILRGGWKDRLGAGRVSATFHAHRACL